MNLDQFEKLLNSGKFDPELRLVIIAGSEVWYPHIIREDPVRARFCMYDDLWDMLSVPDKLFGRKAILDFVIGDPDYEIRTLCQHDPNFAKLLYTMFNPKTGKTFRVWAYRRQLQKYINNSIKNEVYDVEADENEYALTHNLDPLDVPFEHMPDRLSKTVEAAMVLLRTGPNDIVEILRRNFCNDKMVYGWRDIGYEIGHERRHTSRLYSMEIRNGFREIIKKPQQARTRIIGGCVDYAASKNDLHKWVLSMSKPWNETRGLRAKK